ncbi:MAG: hypothetical protein ACYTFW_15070, partial [Planctomycetota bacterium]
QRKNKANSKPNKAKRRPLAGNPKHEILNPKEMNGCQMTEHDFKKQSQFNWSPKWRKCFFRRML